MIKMILFLIAARYITLRNEYGLEITLEYRIIEGFEKSRLGERVVNFSKN